jgi:hypothetical protein
MLFHYTARLQPICVIVGCVLLLYSLLKNKKNPHMWLHVTYVVCNYLPHALRNLNLKSLKIIDILLIELK